MSKLRSVHQIMSAAVLAIDGRGLQRIASNLLRDMHGAREALPLMLAHGDGEVDRMPEEASSWREFIKSTGLFPYYVNPDGQVVHTMDEDFKDRIAKGAVAVMPVIGAMVREAWSYEEIFWGLCSSDRLTKFIRSVANDDRVVGCVATINSPGGMVSGNEKLGRAWAALGAKKTTVAHVDDMACSAAYWFACNSGQVMLDGYTCDVGSIGVMMSFWDIIPMIEKMWGAKYVELYSNRSDKKNEDWRAFREQQDPAKFKASMDENAVLFQEGVRRARGAKLANDPAILAGRVYMGQAAIDAGLADGFGDMDACIHLVRSTTPTAAAPPANDPNEQIPPPVKDQGATSTAQPKTDMSLKTRLVALAAAIFSSKEKATREDVTAANEEIAANGTVEGVEFITTDDAKAAKEHVALVDAAKAAQTTAEQGRATAEGQVTELTTERDAAVQARDTATTELNAVNTELQAVATEMNITVAEGQTLAAAVVASLKATKASLTEAQAKVAKLEGEDATATPSNPKASEADTNNPLKNAELAEADEAVANWVKQ